MTQNDKNIVRELAKQYMEMAASEKQQKMNRRMKATNDLSVVRPPVLIDEIPWYQMDIDGELTCLCEDGRARAVEYEFRKAIYRWKHLKADTLFEPFYRVKTSYDSTGIGIAAKDEIRRTDDTNKIVSHSYADLLEDEESLEQIKIPTFTARPDKDEANMEFFTDLLGDAIPVKLCGREYLYHAPWDVIVRLRGVEPVLFDLYDRPEYLHAIRQRFYDIAAAELDFVEKHLHVDNTVANLHCTPAYVSGLADDGWKATWFRGMAQSFGDISPAMFEEFEVDYSKKLAERFAYTYYGCCEPLDKKLDIIIKFPNLRKVGVSPWANEDVMAEWIGGRYVYSRKPSPANVAIKTDPDVIRRETEKTVKLCIKNGCPCDITLKDISTVSHRPENLIIWASTVSEVLDNYYGE